MIGRLYYCGIYRMNHPSLSIFFFDKYKHLETLNLECIENGNISVQHLGRKGLHLNSKGKGRPRFKFPESNSEILKARRTLK